MRRLARASGVIIGLLGVAFVVRELARDHEVVLTAVGRADVVPLAVAFPIGLASMATIGLAWRRCLAVVGVERPRLDTLLRYFVGQLGKYVPGGVWPVVGRAEMARRAGIDGTVAYGSTVLSMGLTYLAAMLTALGALLVGGAGAGVRTHWVAVLALLPIGVAALHPAVVERCLALLRRVTSRPLEVPVPAWSTSVALLVWHVPAWLGIGLATWLVAVSLDPTGASLRNIVFATTLSWIVGFLAVGVPGGIGVREAVFVVAATSLASAGVAAAVAVVARVVFVLVDVTGAGLTSLLAVADGSRPDGPPSDRGSAELG